MPLSFAKPCESCTSFGARWSVASVTGSTVWSTARKKRSLSCSFGRPSIEYVRSMPFQASSLAMVQSTEICRTSPTWTQGRGRLRACAARIFCVSVIGRTDAETIERCYMHRVGAARNSRVAQVCWRGHGYLVRAPEYARLVLPRDRGPDGPHARGRGGDLRGAAPALPGPARADRRPVGAGAALPAAGHDRALQAGTAGVDRRDAVRSRVPRAPHGLAGAGG